MRGPFIEGAKVGLILATVECAIRSIVKVIYADRVPPKGFDHAKSLAAPASRLDDDTIRDLRALGYLH